MAEQSSTLPVPHEHFTIGDWLVEASLDRVSRDGAVIHLRPQLTDLLVVLARRAGRTVPKHVILSEVWGSEYVGDSALTRCIAEIRQAFGDDARQPRVIETIPKRGYRLVAPVVFLGTSEPSKIAEPGPALAVAPRVASSTMQDAAVSVTLPSCADEQAIAEDVRPGDEVPQLLAWRSLGTVHWKILLALALLMVLVLAAGRCGARNAAQKPTRQTDVRESATRPVTGDSAPLVRLHGSGEQL